MEKQFVTYEIALKLKELGFDEECLNYYHNDNENTNDLNFYLFPYCNTIGITTSQLQSNKEWKIALLRHFGNKQLII